MSLPPNRHWPKPEGKAACPRYGGLNPSRRETILTARRDEILSEMRMAPRKTAEVDAVSIGQKSAVKARRAVSAMSWEAQQELARRGIATLYQAKL